MKFQVLIVALPKQRVLVTVFFKKNSEKIKF